MTPADALGPVKTLPIPKFSIGQRVAFSFQNKSDRAYVLRKYTRHLVRKNSKVCRSLVRQGYFPQGKLPNSAKNEIRQCLRRVAEAEELVIVGIRPWSMYNIDTTNYNECYIGGVSGASSPLEYEYQVMVRFKNEAGNNMALVTGYPMGFKNCFKAID